MINRCKISNQIIVCVYSFRYSNANTPLFTSSFQQSWDFKSIVQLILFWDSSFELAVVDITHSSLNGLLYIHILGMWHLSLALNLPIVANRMNLSDHIILT